MKIKNLLRLAIAAVRLNLMRAFGSYSLNGYSFYGQYDRKLSEATDVVLSMR